MMILDSKNNVYYKNTLKQMLTYVSKFGVGDGSSVYLYNYIDKTTKFTYPVIILNQTTNPWDSSFHPTNLFIIPNDIPEIDIFNSDKNINFHISTSYLIDLKSVKEILKEKSLSIIFDNENDIFTIKNIPFVEKTNDRNIGYIDKFNNIQSLKKLIKSDKNKFNIISSDLLKTVYSEVVEKTFSLVKINESKFIKIFYSICPFLVDSMKYKRMIYISDNDVTSSIYLIQNIKSIEIHNFYKYLDVDFYQIVKKAKK